VQADKDDDHAIEFYRSTPITNEEQVVHFYYTLNSGYNL
jgi:aminoglycoside 3-N-acetyltransferase I